MSILPAHGWLANFKLVDGEDGPRPLILWQEQEDGHVVGLIHDEQTGKLRSAENYTNFDGYTEDPVIHLRQIMPGDRLRAEYRTQDGSTQTEPVDVIGLTLSGELRTLSFDTAGIPDEVTDIDQGFVRMYHAGESDAATPPRTPQPR